MNEKIEYKHGSTNVEQLRILDYMHYASASLRSDSNFYTQHQIIKYLNKHYPDYYHFYLTYPKSSENDAFIHQKFLGVDNVTLIGLRYNTTNAFYRDEVDIETLNNELKEDVDLLYCNTPEVTLKLLSFLQSKGNYVNAVTYSNWLPNMVEEPMLLYYKDTSYGKYAIRLKYLINYLATTANFTHSEHSKKILIDSYKFIDSPSFKNYVTKSFKVLNITCDIESKNSYKYRDEKLVKLERKAKDNEEIIILFNYRHNDFTGFPFFMKNIKEFIKKHSEFNIKIALTSVRNDLSAKYNIEDKYFINKENLNYEDYVKLLYKSDIIIGAHTSENMWSLAFIDGLMSYNIPIYRTRIFFDELMKDINTNSELTFNTDIEFQGSLFKVCSNLDYYRKIARKISNKILKYWTWDTKIHDFHKALQTYAKQKSFNLSDERKAEIEKYLKDTNHIFWKSLKNAMSMGEQRPLNIYRKVIKNNLQLRDDMKSEKSILIKKDAKVKLDRQKSLFIY
jgi:hypothetical protein